METERSNGVCGYSSNQNEHIENMDSNNNCSMIGNMILQVLDYYITGMIIILISFRLEDRSSLFSMWFWRYRVIFNIILMIVITVFAYLEIYCDICFYNNPYKKQDSFVRINDNNYYLGYILFVYSWIASCLLPFLFIYLATGKIKTDKYSPKNLKDIMIMGDIIGIFELEIFGIFRANKNKKISKRNVYTLTACNLDWTELNEDALMRYLSLLEYSEVKFDEIYDPFDSSNNLLIQLCRNQKDCYRWFTNKKVTDLLRKNKDSAEIIACCCQSGNFRVFKNVIKYFGSDYLKQNALISLHYAFHCLGTEFQQKQANRIIVYIMKNTQINIQQFIEWYSEEEEQHEIKKLVEKKFPNIKQIQIELINKKNNGETRNEKKRLSGNHLTIGNREKSELLTWQLSNNSIVTIEDSEDDQLDSDHFDETF